MKTSISLLTFVVFLNFFDNRVLAQNSMTGDGFGGRGWYVPHNYQVGAYSAFTVCGDSSQLYGWGGNYHGELGDGTTISTTLPVATAGMNHVKFYTTGYISGAIKQDSTAWVWGSPSQGFTLLPSQTLTNVKFIDGAISFIVFVRNDGTVWGAGRNTNGQLGDGQPTPIPTANPVQMTGVTTAVRAVAGFNATIILLSDGTVKITGGLNIYQSPNSTIPVNLPGLTDIVDIKVNTKAAFALDRSGNVFAFGNGQAYLGLGAIGNGAVTPPTRMIFPANAASIVALSSNCDGTSTMALDSNHNVYGWGFNGYGELGTGNSDSVLSPVLIASNVKDIYAGETFCYILKDDNTLWASGWSAYGGSIWMNLSNVPRNIFTQIDPLIPPMNLCAPKIHGVVPITLISFNCSKNGNATNINWTSSEEVNAGKYVLEYCNDGINFQSIETFSAKGSNSNYNYEHYPLAGKAFYRLKMIDKDGLFTYSAIRRLTFERGAKTVIAPNPTHQFVQVFSKTDININAIQILTTDGKTVKNIDGYHRGEKLDVSGLSTGTYFVKIIYYNKDIEFSRIVKY